MTDNEDWTEPWAERLTLPTEDGGFVLISEIAAVTAARGGRLGQAWLKGISQTSFMLAVDATTARERVVALHAMPQRVGMSKEPPADGARTPGAGMSIIPDEPASADPEGLTPVELYTLPEGSLVLDGDDDVWERVDGGWLVNGSAFNRAFPTASTDLAEDCGPIRLVKRADD